MIRLLLGAIGAVLGRRFGHDHDEPLPSLDEFKPWDGRTYRARPGELIVNGMTNTAEGLWFPADGHDTTVWRIPDYTYPERRELAFYVDPHQ